MIVFNISINNKLIGKEIVFQEMQNLLNISSKTLSEYIAKRDSDQLEIKGYTVQVVTLERHYDVFLKKHLRQWNDRVAAAEMIRSGKGKIVTKKINGKYRKVTVPR